MLNYTISINLEVAQQILKNKSLTHLEAIMVESIEFETIEQAIASLNTNIKAMCAKLNESGKYKIYSLVNEGKNLADIDPWESDEVCRIYITHDTIDVKDAISNPVVESSIFKLEN